MFLFCFRDWHQNIIFFCASTLQGFKQLSIFLKKSIFLKQSQFSNGQIVIFSTCSLLNWDGSNLRNKPWKDICIICYWKVQKYLLLVEKDCNFTRNSVLNQSSKYFLYFWIKRNNLKRGKFLTFGRNQIKINNIFFLTTNL